MVEKFHSRRLREEGAKAIPTKVQGDAKVPFILHSEDQHKKNDVLAQGRNFEGEAVGSRPAIGSMELGEVERHIDEFGKVVQT